MNAKTELIEHIKQREVKYVHVVYEENYDQKTTIEGTLESVLERLDFDYDNGYGGQELFGIIWYEDGTWSDRREYDGSEWWEHHKCPDLPNDKVDRPERAAK